MAIKPLDHLSDAPCYWEVADDGAAWTCRECQGKAKASEVYACLTPDGKTLILHKDCIDQDWLSKAKKMEGKI